MFFVLTTPEKSFAFATFDSFMEWIGQEVQYWNWMSTAYNRYSSILSSVYSKTVSPVNEISNQANQLRNAGYALEDLKMQFESRVQPQLSAYSNGTIPAPNSSTRQFIDKLKDVDEPTACFALQYLNGDAPILNATLPYFDATSMGKLFSGAVQAELFKAGVSQKTVAKLEAQSRSASEMQQELSQKLID
ncbi:MAG: hypothetical protein ACRCV9_04205, partial [Burkholderiaceae bacterium]